MKLNKRGQTGYSTIFIYRLMMILILIGGTVLIVVTQFSKPIDLRTIEAQELSKITFDCIKSQGLNSITNESLQECFNYDKSENGIKINYDDKLFSVGKWSIITICEGGKEVNSKVGCYSSEYPIQYNNQIKKINILVGISKANKNT